MERPRTRNPKLNHLVEELEHSHNAHPSGVDTGIDTSGAFSAHDTSAHKNSFNVEGSSSEVFWSAAGDVIPTEQLARPHTSNPRYMRDTSTPLKPEEVNRSPRAGNTPQISSPSEAMPSPSPDSDDDSKTTHAVLWAAEGDKVDPELVARPITSNPWLARVIDSTSPVSEKRSRKHSASEIIWSSGEVDDWRMLARPHAANPKYEAAANETPTPPDDALTPMSGRRQSEILWKADEEGPAAQEIATHRARIQELENEVIFLRSVLEANGIQVPANPTPIVSQPPVSPAQPSSAPPQSSAAAEPAASSTHHVRFQDGDQQVDVKDLPSPVRPAPRDVDTSMDDGGIVDDDTPDEEVDPELDVPKTPPTARNAKTGVSGRPASAQHSRDGPGSGSKFVNKYKFVSGQYARPGTAQPTRPAAPNTQVATQGYIPGRPQSAPTARMDAPPSQTLTQNFMSTISSPHATISTTALSHDTDDGLLAEYNKMKRPNAPLVEKADFHEAYQRRAAEYGVIVSDRSIERMLAPYCAEGAKYLSVNEFAILYLKLQQW